MNAKLKDIPWVNSNQFNENANKFSPSELNQLAGQWVAWNLEGSAILAHAADLLELDRQLKHQGLDPAQVVQEYLPPVEQFLGGTLDR